MSTLKLRMHTTSDNRGHTATLRSAQIPRFALNFRYAWNVIHVFAVAANYQNA